jgi:hypothetical protein
VEPLAAGQGLVQLPDDRLAVADQSHLGHVVVVLDLVHGNAEIGEVGRYGSVNF